MKEYEKLGVFYLGKEYDPVKKEVVADHPILLESKNLTTHAVCLGMTGSGKTGLGIALLEEAALDKIPAIIIDPKGDLTNLLLTFPNLSPQEFEPWVDPSEAQRKGVSLADYAADVANNWREGLKKWEEGSERIQRLKASADAVIYTPASQAGVPLSILNSFSAPSEELMLDQAAVRDRVSTLASSLLGLIGVEADPIKSREQILISAIIEQAWHSGNDLSLETLIQQVQKPPFEKIGALHLETFYPVKERVALSVSLNALLASPVFKAWMQGEPLNIQKLLNNEEGKPKLSVISIAHLSDHERMFFVTLLLNEIMSWMRKQPGTPSLRALLYMDEIFGFFPPTAAPPSKLPMLTLLKQARAFGLGIVLATQNPVDLDYKGLANCGIWFIGKLQTERDRVRVVEGLNAASNGELDVRELGRLLAAAGKRIFVMRSIYHEGPILFETRWTMSYLRGPLTLTQIAQLTGPYPEKTIVEEVDKPDTFTKPIVPAGVDEYFARRPDLSRPTLYRPMMGGFAKLHFVESKNKIDVWKEVNLLAPFKEGKVDWENAESVPDIKKQFDKAPVPKTRYEELPPRFLEAKNYEQVGKSLAAALYQDQGLDIFYYAPLKITSTVKETEGDFRARVTHALREQRDEQTKKVHEKYQSKINLLKDRMRRAQTKVSQQQNQAGWQKMETYISIGATILGALLGKKVTKGTITQAGTSMRRAGRISKEDQDVADAEENYSVLEQQLNEQYENLEKEIAQLPVIENPTELKLETMQIRPRKADMDIEKVALVWWPVA